MITCVELRTFIDVKSRTTYSKFIAMYSCYELE